MLCPVYGRLAALHKEQVLLGFDEDCFRGGCLLFVLPDEYWYLDFVYWI